MGWKEFEIIIIFHISTPMLLAYYIIFAFASANKKATKEVP